MMNLVEALAQGVDEKALQADLFARSEGEGTTADARVAMAKRSPATKPILQLNALPQTIDQRRYKNALSSENPNGSLSPLWAFRQLVDPIPTFSRYYSASGSSMERTYSDVASGASITDDDPFVASVISRAQQSLAQTTYANMDATLGTWAPVYATPSDWYDTRNGRYLPLDFDLGGSGSRDSPFAVIGGEERRPSLTIHGEGTDLVSKPLDSSTRVNQISLEYLVVNLSRPWLDPLLFKTDGWHLARQPAGFCSSGSIKKNNGVIPLIPSSVIFATAARVDVHWAASDQTVIDAARSANKAVALSNLILDFSNAEQPLQVLGWLASLVPLSPKRPAG